MPAIQPRPGGQVQLDTPKLDGTLPIPFALTPLGTATGLAVKYLREIAIAAGIPWTERNTNDVAVMVRSIAEAASLELIMKAIDT
jgi:hypothetical protein